MFASSGGFAVAILQRDNVREVEAARGEALQAVLHQVTLVELAIERLGSLGSAVVADASAPLRE